MAAADSEAVHRGDDRLGDVANRLVQVADLEHAALARSVVAGLGALFDIATGTEGLLPRTGEDDRLHAAVGPGAAEGVDHFLHGLRAERVVPLRPVHRDDRGRSLDRVVDVLVIHPAHSSVIHQRL